MRGGAREGVEGGTDSVSVSDSSLVPVQFQVCEAVAGWILVQSFREGGQFQFQFGFSFSGDRHENYRTYLLIAEFP